MLVTLLVWALLTAHCRNEAWSHSEEGRNKKIRQRAVLEGPLQQRAVFDNGA
jgi:hypothetical protein